MDVLGFGCSAVDFDLNGIPDVMVTNGHIDDTTETDEPFAQPMQLFTLRNGRYETVNVDSANGYWQRPHIGRAMARLDYNADGKDDVVITNLNEPSSLLLNNTKTNHHWLKLELVGTSSPRLPIGTRILVTADKLQYHHALVAGDGYLARNEPVITVGLGQHVDPVSVVIDWPDGSTETFKNLNVDQTIQIVQGIPSAFVLDHH